MAFVGEQAVQALGFRDKGLWLGVRGFLNPKPDLVAFIGEQAVQREGVPVFCREHDLRKEAELEQAVLHLVVADSTGFVHVPSDVRRRRRRRRRRRTVMAREEKEERVQSEICRGKPVHHEE